MAQTAPECHPVPPNNKSLVDALTASYNRIVRNNELLQMAANNAVWGRNDLSESEKQQKVEANNRAYIEALMAARKTYRDALEKLGLKVDF